MVNTVTRNLAVALLGTAALISSLVHAAPAEFAGSPLEGADIQAIQSLPVRGMKAVVANNRLMFISDTGRYVFVGDLYDTWNFKKLASLQEVMDSATRVNLKSFNLNVDNELAPFTYGKGTKEVVIFIDPNCPHCHSLLQKLPELASDYRFQLLPVPVLGNDSGRRVRQLGCATDRNAALDALVAGRDPSDLKQVENCDLLPLQKTLVTAQVLGLEGVPFIIAPDGRVNRGVPQDFQAFLTGGR